jgi:hypothetical protein
MDSNLAQRRRSLEEKIPDIKKTLDMVVYLHERRVRRLSLSADKITIELDSNRKVKESLQTRMKMILMIWTKMVHQNQ